MRRSVRYDTLVYALGSNIDVAAVPGVAEHCASLVGAPSAPLRDRLTQPRGRSPTAQADGRPSAAAA